MDGLDAGGGAQSEGELNGGHCSGQLMHLSEGCFLSTNQFDEQEELVLGSIRFCRMDFGRLIGGLN
jgi:hypothetical protein